MRILFWMLLLLLNLRCDSVPGWGGQEDEPQVVWSIPATDLQISPVGGVIDGERAYLPLDRRLLCVELRSGKIQWSAPLGVHAQLNGSILLQDETTIYAYHGSNWVKAFDKQHGGLQWYLNLWEEQVVPGLGDMVQDNTYLYVPDNNEILRISKQDGQLVSRIPVTGLLPPDEPVQRVNQTALDDDFLCVPTDYEIATPTVARNGNLFGYDTRQEEALWGQAVRFWRAYNPALGDSVVQDVPVTGCALTEQIVVASELTQLSAYRRSDGALLWRQRFDEDGLFYGGPAIVGSTVYVTGVAQKVYAFDLATGTKRWETLTEGSFSNDNVVVYRDRLYVVNKAFGTLWVLDPETGRVLWSGRPPQKTGDERYRSWLAIDNGYLVVVGNYYAYGLKL